MRRWLVITPLLALAAVGLAATGYGAFVATAANAGNSFSAGSVGLSDNDAGTAMFTSLTSVRANDTAARCITVRAEGSLPAGVRLYGSVGGPLATFLTLTVTRGSDATPSFGSCASFVADATDYLGQGPGVVYAGPLSSFPSSWAAGIVDPSAGGGSETWTQNESHAYRFVLTAGSDTAAQGLGSTASFTWEARSE
jgi:hypothetical protein